MFPKFAGPNLKVYPKFALQNLGIKKSHRDQFSYGNPKVVLPEILFRQLYFCWEGYQGPILPLYYKTPPLSSLRREEILETLGRILT